MKRIAHRRATLTSSSSVADPARRANACQGTAGQIQVHPCTATHRTIDGADPLATASQLRQHDSIYEYVWLPLCGERAT